MHVIDDFQESSVADAEEPLLPSHPQADPLFSVQLGGPHLPPLTLGTDSLLHICLGLFCSWKGP